MRMRFVIGFILFSPDVLLHSFCICCESNPVRPFSRLNETSIPTLLKTQTVPVDFTCQTLTWPSFCVSWDAPVCCRGKSPGSALTLIQPRHAVGPPLPSRALCPFGLSLLPSLSEPRRSIRSPPLRGARRDRTHLYLLNSLLPARRNCFTERRRDLGARQPGSLCCCWRRTG